MHDRCLCEAGSTLCNRCSSRRSTEIATWGRAREAEERLAPQIVAFAERAWGARLTEEAARLFRVEGDSQESLERTLTAFATWFAFMWVPNWLEDDEDCAIDIPADWPTTSLGITWLTSMPHAASAFEHRFIVTAAESPYSFWAVEALRRGWCLDVRDLLTGHRLRVVDPEIADRIQLADIVLSAVVTLDGVSTFLGCVSHTLPPACRGDVRDTRKCYAEQIWMTREELIGADWERFSEYRSEYDDWPSFGLDPGNQSYEPLVLSWELRQPFAVVFEALRPLSLWDDEEAIEAEYRPDGTPQVLMTWSEACSSDDPDDRRMIAYLHLDEQCLVADVPCRLLAERLAAEVATRVGGGAGPVTIRPSSMIRVHDRQVASR